MHLLKNFFKNFIITKKIKKFISGSYDETIKIWDLDSNKCISTITGHHYAVVCLLQISNDNSNNTILKEELIKNFLQISLPNSKDFP